MTLAAGSASPGRSWFAAATRGAVATGVCAMPVFFTGALAVQLSQDLAFAATGLGAAVAIHHAVAAASALPFGRLTDRLGAVICLRLAVVLAAVSGLGIALAARSWTSFVLWLLLAGSSRGLVQPAANRLLINRAHSERLGIAFGLKQSAPPIAAMLGGLSVPLIALNWGWRWAFGLAFMLALAVLLTIGPRPQAAQRTRTAAARGKAPLRDRPNLAVLGIGFALGFAANSALLAFFVAGAVHSGTSERLAGIVLALASGVAILTRLVAGVVCDRTAIHPLMVAGGLLAVGAVGMIMLAPGQPALVPVGGLVATFGTWGFPGVFWLAMMRAYRDTPGRATGTISATAAVGGMLGPMVFGLLVDRAGYGTGWLYATIAASLAAALMVIGARRLQQAHA